MSGEPRFPSSFADLDALLESRSQLQEDIGASAQYGHGTEAEGREGCDEW
jgi:hypothetical protein